DLTVENAAEVFETCKNSKAEYWGFKEKPMDFKAYYNSKRNFSMLICSLGSVLYILVLGMVCLVMGFITPQSGWTILVGAGIAFLGESIIINCMLLKNAKKPQFDWDSETEFSRKLTWVNVVVIVIGVAMFIAFMLSILSPFIIKNMRIDDGLLLTVIAVVAFVVAAALFVTAFAVNRFAVKKAEQYLLRHE
ncbi:MAG: hypothetical protein II082_03475, partial [Ruminococcus sp.]|nr:hypothetical protein [Ruminococcus sp.]